MDDDRHRAKPRHLWPDYGAQFSEPEVAAAYRHRPPYPQEALAVVLGLLGPDEPVVLELGAGSGDFTAMLGPAVGSVTALEPSDSMRILGERRTAGSGNVAWRAASAEDFVPEERYAGVVAAESLHWMAWSRVLPRIAEWLLPGGFLTIVARGLVTPPWQSDLQDAIDRHTTNPHYQPCRLTDELEQRGLFRLIGRHDTQPTAFAQTVDDYVESFHSRNGFSRRRMSSEAAHGFDREVTALAEPFAIDGRLVLQTTATVWWGVPLGGRQRAGPR